jgi:hypothetical protein
MISRCSDPDRKKQYHERKKSITELPAEKLSAAQQRLRMMFKRGPHVSRSPAISIVRILAYFGTRADANSPSYFSGAI